MKEFQSDSVTLWNGAIRNISTFLSGLLFFCPSISYAWDAKLANLIADGYDANRKAIRSLNCFFQYRNGFATTVKEATTGEYKKSGQQLGHWVIKEDSYLYTLQCSSESKRDTQSTMINRSRTSQNGIMIVPCLELFHLTSSDGYSLLYSPEISGAKLIPPTQEMPHIEFTPFTLAGAMTSGGESVASPSSLLRLAIAAGRTFTISAAIENSVEFFDINIEGKDDEVDIYFRVNPSFGFLPTKFILSSHKSGVKRCEAVLLDAKQLGNGSWIPICAINVQNPESASPFYTYDIEVSEVHEDVVLADLSLQIPKSVQIGIRGEGKCFNLEEDRTILATDLHDLYIEVSARSEAFSPATQMPNNNPMGLPFDSLMIVNIVLIILLSMIIIYKRMCKMA